MGNARHLLPLSPQVEVCALLENVWNNLQDLSLTRSTVEHASTNTNPIHSEPESIPSALNPLDKTTDGPADGPADGPTDGNRYTDGDTNGADGTGDDRNERDLEGGGRANGGPNGDGDSHDDDNNDDDNDNDDDNVGMTYWQKCQQRD